MKHFRNTAILALMLGASSALASSRSGSEFETVSIPAQAINVGAEIEVIYRGETSLLSVDKITLSEFGIRIVATDDLGEASLIEIDT